MNKDEWYRDRILWKASQHKLFNKKCRKFSELQSDQASLVSEVIPENANPVLAFWDNPDRWTVLGTREIFSFYDGNLVSSSLDDINKQLSVFNTSSVNREDIKVKSNFISLDEVGKLVWVPAGSELFALMNILQMFPLAEKNIT
jgi:hypothetical protein